MSLFKRAYARGVNDELIRLGLVRYPTKLAADELADAVGDQMPEEPAAAMAEGTEMPTEPVSPETAAEVAATLIDAANTLVEETAGAGMAEAGAPPMPAEEELKTSAARDLDTRAHNQGYAVMVKAAQEKQATGATIEGGDQGNAMADAVAAETLMEAANRPDGKYVKGVQGVGQTDSPAGRGTGVVGDEQIPAPEAPGATDAGSNSVTTQAKMGMLRAIIQKVASGSTIMGGDTGGNTLSQAAGVTGEGKIEADRRPDGYATNMRGQTDLPVTPAATVGTEQPHPDQPGASTSGSTPGGAAGNSVVAFSNEAKTGAADPFLTLFKKTADETAAHLPTNLGEDVKIGHIRQMMGMTDVERNQYIGLLHKEAGATDDQAVAAATKHAACASERRRYSGNPGRQNRTRQNLKTAQMPEALAEALDKKEEGSNGNGNGEVGKEMPFPPKAEAKAEESAAEEKKEEKKEETKEGADLLSRIRRISQSVRA